MQTEFEVKFYPVDKEQIRAKLKDIGAKLEHPERLMTRTIFGKETNPLVQVDYIRVRDEGDLVRMSAKVHAIEGGDISDQKEVDVAVSDYNACISILTLAGLKVTRTQETKRETWKIDQGEVVIDTWPSLETYIEIEAVSKEEVMSIAKKLGLDWETHRITSVIEIYSEVYNESTDVVLEKVGNCTFDEPPY